MEDFKTRLLDEDTQLEDKIIKLRSFLESDKVNTIDPVQHHLLRTQKSAMEAYKNCLTTRLYLLKD